MSDTPDTIDQPYAAPSATDQHRDVPAAPVGLRRAAFLTASFGMAHALLLLLAFWLLKMRAPSLNATDAEIVDFYSDPDNRRLVLAAGIYLIPFSAIAFIWFIVALRMWAAGSVKRINQLFANVQLVAGIIYITLLLTAGAAMSVLAASVELSSHPIDPALARQFPRYGVSLFVVLSMRMAAMVVFATTSLLRREGLLPRWFLAAGAFVGLLLLLSASVSSWLIVVFPSWLLVLSLILIGRARQIPRDLVLPPQGDTAARRAILRHIHAPQWTERRRG